MTDITLHSMIEKLKIMKNRKYVCVHVQQTKCYFNKEKKIVMHCNINNNKYAEIQILILATL